MSFIPERNYKFVGLSLKLHEKGVMIRMNLSRSYLFVLLLRFYILLVVDVGFSKRFYALHESSLNFSSFSSHITKSSI